MSAFSDFGVPGLILCRPIDAYEEISEKGLDLSYQIYLGCKG